MDHNTDKPQRAATPLGVAGSAWGNADLKFPCRNSPSPTAVLTGLHLLAGPPRGIPLASQGGQESVPEKPADKPFTASPLTSPPSTC